VDFVTIQKECHRPNISFPMAASTVAQQATDDEDDDDAASPSLGRVIWKARGAVWILVITTLVSFGWGSVLGLVSSVFRSPALL
jgi:hypothetical protein